LNTFIKYNVLSFFATLINFLPQVGILSLKGFPWQFYTTIPAGNFDYSFSKFVHGKYFIIYRHAKRIIEIGKSFFINITTGIKATPIFGVLRYFCMLYEAGSAPGVLALSSV
jgi:hypothetical protein